MAGRFVQKIRFIGYALAAAVGLINGSLIWPAVVHAEQYDKVEAVSRSKGGAPDPEITVLLKELQKQIALQSLSAIFSGLLAPDFECDPLFAESCPAEWNVKQKFVAQLELAEANEVTFLPDPEKVARTYDWSTLRREVGAGLGGALVANPDGSYCTSAEIGYDRKRLAEASKKLNVESFAWRCALDDPVTVFGAADLNKSAAAVKNECVATGEAVPGPVRNNTNISVAMVELPDGTKGYVAHEELSEPAYSGLCMKKIDGAWKITTAIGDISAESTEGN